MIARRADELAAAVGGRLVAGDPAARVTGASIDSRTLRPGEAFFAIVARNDGHAFAADAAGRGAPAVVASRPVDLPRGVALVLVDDTVSALGRLAADERNRRRGMKVVAVTGSAGKTTTTALVRAALGARWRAGGTRGNWNNRLGLPLSLLALDPAVEAAALELGMNRPGEIRELAGIADPDVGIVTLAARAHLGFFPGVEAIARAKAELWEAMAAAPSPDRPRVAVLPDDDPALLELARGTNLPVISFGLGPAADVRAEEITRTPAGGVAFRVEGRPVELALWGRHAVRNALAALAAARALGIPLGEAAARLAEVEPLPGRGRFHRLEDGTVVVDETYNANPDAVLAVLGALADFPVTGRRVAVLGDMLELGDRAPALHREIGAAAAAAGFDPVWAVGNFAGEVAAGARTRGADTGTWPDAAAAAAELPGRVRPGDLVLVKGSRGVRLELLLEQLLATRRAEEPR